MLARLGFVAQRAQTPETPAQPLKPRRRSRGPGASRPPTRSCRRSGASPSTGTSRWAATTRPSCSLRTTLYNGGRSSAWSPRSPFYATADLANVMHAVPLPPDSVSQTTTYLLHHRHAGESATGCCSTRRARRFIFPERGGAGGGGPSVPSFTSSAAILSIKAQIVELNVLRLLTCA